MRELDHLVVAARTLDEGAAWVEARLGVAPVRGGKHDTMGTHNRLLRLGERTYLEVIAIDPDASAPARARWFALDSLPMQARLARGPALIHWVERTDAIEAEARASADALEILSLARGPYRWRIGVPADGHLPGAGASATLIEWEGPAHPAADLPESGCTLTRLDTGGGRLRAHVATPGGPRVLE